MFKFIGFIVVSLLLSSCVEEEQVIKRSSLLVEKITTDTNKAALIKQINIKFNQDIAIVGAIPNRTQINSISLSHDLKQQCQWRFIRLNILSCDLKTRLTLMTDYDISVASTFHALGSQLSKRFDHVITTPIPILNLDLTNNDDDFSISGYINNFEDIDISITALARYLILKSPTGSRYPVSVIKEQEANQERIKITVKDLPKVREDGRYEFILPAGFQASKSQRKLPQEYVIKSFRHNNRLTFYGFSCWSSMYPFTFKIVELNSEGLLPCAPERIGLIFSAWFKQMGDNYSLNSLSWLTGDSVNFKQLSFHNNELHLGFELVGNSQYELDLTELTNKKGNISNPQIVSFKTQEATPLWGIKESDKNVIEAQYQALPSVVRRNVELLTQDITPINNSQELLSFLNVKDSLISFEDELVETPNAKIKLTKQPISFRQTLKEKSGLAHVKLMGHSIDNHSNNNDVLPKSKSLMVNAAAFNMAVWHQKDLMIQLIDWDGIFVESANISLVCEGGESPLLLGMTEANGMLWIKEQAWQKTYGDFRKDKNECWLWADKLTQTAAIEVPSVNLKLHDSIKAMAWSTQPIYQRGDLVEIGFIARKRTQQGLIPLTSLDNYRLEIRNQNEKPIPIILSTPSDMGFAKGMYQLTDDMPQGIYRFWLVDDELNSGDFLGEFIVTKFIAPEFEHNLSIPSAVFSYTPMKISIKANRMNGVALTGAKTNFNFNIRRNYGVPKSWPKDFEFNSWADFDNNKNKLEKGSLLNQPLDLEGKLITNLQDYQSTVPYGEMTITSEIIADDGTTQTNRVERPYFSRKHYIGTKYNKGTQQLEIIAIDYQGNPIHDVNVSVDITASNDDKDKTTTKIASCQFDRLPAYCNVSEGLKSLTVNILSGDESYQWYRNIYKKQSRDLAVSDVKNTLELRLDDKKTILGEDFNIKLESPFSGIVTFILNGDNIKKTWQQSVKKGENVIQFKADKSWLPSIRLFAALSVSRETANQAIKQQLSKLDKKNKHATRVGKHHLSNLGSQRLFTDDIVIPVLSNKSIPKVTLLSAEKSVLAGSAVNISINSTQEAQTQLWLVNDALLALFNKELTSYDFNNKLSSRFYSNRLEYDALSEHLAFDALLGISSVESEHSSAISSSLGSGFGIGDMSRRPTPPPNISKNKYKYLHSRFLKLLDLKKGKSQSVSIELPQLIGRWKIIALTATNQTASITALDIVTTRPVEYFIDAPDHVYLKDVSQLAITAINQSNKELTDTLTLWDGDTALTTLDVHLQAKKQERLVIELPMLSVGEHPLRLTSNKDVNYINYHNISVNPALFNYHKKWLMNASQKGNVAKPKNAIKDSVKLSYQTLNNTSPDWQALAIYNKDYPHQCWEQTISRALTFSVNPQADDIWPSGRNILQNELNKNKQGVFFSYFNNTQSDDFLTAYTYLIDGWLTEDKFNIRIDKEKLIEMLRLLTSADEDLYRSVTNQERSMALLALAVHNDITLDEALVYRQEIGLSDPFSLVLQSLALKELGADKALYQTQLLEFNDTTYQDDTTNLFSQTSHQCFAALAYDENSIEREQLIGRVIAKQQELGHFGSTFANGVCSYLLKDKQVTNNSPSHELPYKIGDENLTYNIEGQPAHWLTLDYQESLADVIKQSNGINITRERLLRVNDDWQPILDDTPLKIGDIVKTVLSIKSAINREHIAVTDSVAGGLEVISPFLKNAFYHKGRDYGWAGQNHIEINEGQVKWYIINLPKGGQKYAYYSRVRHQGTFLTGPANAQAMYRTDINARTASSVMTID